MKMGEHAEHVGEHSEHILSAVLPNAILLFSYFINNEWSVIAIQFFFYLFYSSSVTCTYFAILFCSISYPGYMLSPRLFVFICLILFWLESFSLVATVHVEHFHFISNRI